MSEVKKKKTQYIDGKKFLTHLVIQKNIYNWHKKHGTLDEFEQDPYIIDCYMLLCKRLATKYNFSGYSYKEDMISEGLMNCYLYWHNFNPDKSTNVFAYFTQISSQAFVRYIKKEKKQSVVKDEIMRSMSLDITNNSGHKEFINKYLDG